MTKKRTTRRSSSKPAPADAPAPSAVKRIENWPIERLRANPRNARRHPREQVSRLAESIRRFGFLGQIIVKPDGEILAGHGRMAAALEAGLPTVPVEIVDHLSEAEARMFVVADNRIAELATWDGEMLAAEMAALREMGVDVTATGFDAGELDDLLRKLEAAGAPREQDPGEHASDERERQAAPVSRLGDTWILGDHRLRCADARAPRSWEGLLERGETAACVHTDPPYGVSYRDGAGSGVRNDDLTGDALVDLIARSFTNALAHARDDAAWYIWHASGQWRADFIAGMTAVGLVERQYIIWAKPTPNLGRGDYQWAHEPCFYAAREGTTPQWHGGRDQGTVWRIGVQRTDATAVVLGSGVIVSTGRGEEISITPVGTKDGKRRRLRLEGGRPVLISQGDSGTDLWEVARDKVTDHATPKPIELVTKALLNSTTVEEIVLDPFVGGGATLIACERTGRRCRALELEPRNIDNVVRRWEQVTGRQAMLAGAGAQTIDELAAERAES